MINNFCTEESLFICPYAETLDYVIMFFAVRYKDKVISKLESNVWNRLKEVFDAK